MGRDLVICQLTHFRSQVQTTINNEKTCFFSRLALSLSSENIKSSVTLHQPSRDATVVKLRCGQIY